MKKILIVVDMQNDFIDGSLGTKEARAIVAKVIEKINGFEGSVVYTRDTHSENYLETEEGRCLPVKHCIKPTFGWEIPGEILDAGSNKNEMDDLRSVYNKPTFGCEELACDLRKVWKKEGGDLEIEIIGLCTDICVVSNALLLKAYMPEVKISVDSGCCAGVTPETHHAALQTMKMCQINVF